MATATTHELVIHERARSAWRDIPGPDQDTLRDILADAARNRRPSAHPKATLLRDGSGLFRIRKGDYRVLCDKDGAQLRVLHAGPRETVYDGTEMARIRANDA